MSILRPSEKSDVVLVIREAGPIAAALRAALDGAAPEERAGLERAVALAEAAAGVSDDRVRADWVRARLAEAGYDGEIDSVRAVRALRQAEPRLTLLAAVQLQKAALAHPE
ncbi:MULTISPECIES: hypothetical protein [Streptomyces]|uniref:Uncharacterized protein n=1 Tax=Streptomyces doudnae TaxID=3075536 RepID=A0ABD5EN45_9ACTN|nr:MULTISPECIES: hypothetical protein [unclassified Streptomyces]MDT0435174.1 hypothetical protein [Streptomyces sp. DSM 41981]MYQ65397.1 hypothetical protein [Streptomyces sp. SID4950]SCD98829.1 hypothetical protein GA0115242_118873 [Streptomyces sp. SolWspMP-5a-2]